MPRFDPAASESYQDNYAVKVGPEKRSMAIFSFDSGEFESKILQQRLICEIIFLWQIGF